MRRSPLFRSFSALLALWFALGLVESAAIHVCPMHDGVAVRAADAAVPAHGAPAHAAAHGNHAPGSGTPDHDEGHLCTCMGACGVAAAVAAPAVEPSEVPVVVADGRPPVLRSRVTVRSASSHLFPPATAPPAARVG